MKSEELLDLIGEADDDLIAEAKEHGKSGGSAFARWGKIAACAALVLGFGGFLLSRSGILHAPGTGAGGSGHSEGSTFASYAGPVLPMTLREENSAISAERRITLDFAPWSPVWISNEEKAASFTGLPEAERQEVLNNYNEWYPEGGHYESSGDILVTDAYTLTNGNAQEQTVRILYPFVSSLRELSESLPALTLNGETLETVLHAGSYAGGFEGAWGSLPGTGENPGSLNLDYYESWEGYRDLLSDGTYLKRALGEFSDLSGTPAIVYTFTDSWGPERNNNADIPNPTIRVMFELDYEKTKVLSYGFNQGLYDREQGRMGKGFSIPQPGRRGYGEPCYLIVVGEDIRDMNCQGYATGGWDTEQNVDVGVTVTRTESDLESALRMAAGCVYRAADDAGDYFGQTPDSGFELYFGLMKEQLLRYGVLAGNGVERYEDGMLENLDVSGVSRVFWLEAEITVPAGNRVELNAVSRKKPSFDFYCSASENQGVSGYDLVTELGSCLAFTGQTAKLEDRGQIEIVRQNFGFDLENGVTEVTLTLPHYYLEVRPPGKE